METSDLTIEILREIRDGIHASKDELRGEMRGMRDDLRGEMRAMREELRTEIHETNIRLSETNVRLNELQARVTDMDLRHMTRMDELVVAVVGARGLEDRVERCEREIAELKRQLTPG